MRTLLASSLLLGAACATGDRGDAGPATLPTHGVLVGEVRADGACVWARGDQPAWMHVELRDSTGSNRVASVSKQVVSDTDFTASVEIPGLAAATGYQARVWFTPQRSGGKPSVATTARFTTAPGPSDSRAVRFAWSGDLAGQNVGRHAQQGFAILPRVLARRPDFFIGLGDMIYGDGVCGPVGKYGNPQVPGDFGPSATLEDYRAHWRYGRADPGLQELLARTPYFGVWDDHEVVNDFGPSHDVRSEPPYKDGQHLMPLGLRTFREYTPLAGAGDGLLYRSVRWGRHLELFFLDNRSHRDPNRARDDGPAPKTQLGLPQLAWLERGLAASDATWKFVISSVPISIPTGADDARDGWADADSGTGFERELAELFLLLRERGIGNTVWLTTDVHFATGFEYTPFPEAPDFHVREFTAGPLSAGLFPREDLDPTFGPRRLFFHGPPVEPASWDEALGWFNFGIIAIDERGALTVEIVDGRGNTVANCAFAP